jgi:hypothetical protein
MTLAALTRLRATRVVAAAAALLALILPAVAHAHGGSGKDYRSKVLRIEPDIPIEAEVEGGDDELRVENKGSETLYVYGYDRRDRDCGTDGADPDEDLYVRIDPDGVQVNHNNPAHYQNQGRYGAPVPDDVDNGRPRWKAESDGAPLYRFHDHRIHWMLKTLPPNVDEDKSGRQKVNTWKVPVRYGDQQACIIGQLDYIGGGSDVMGLVELGGLIAALLAMLVILALAVRQRRRLRREAGAAPKEPAETPAGKES